MRLHIPTDWQDDLIDVVENAPVNELFGGIRTTPFNSGALRNETPISDRIARHIRAAREQGLGFNYVIDAPCHGNREFDLLRKEEMLNHLKELSDLGITAVTVATGFLVELVKKHLGHLNIVVSANGFVDSAEKARQFANLGADAIVVHPDGNRDIALLKGLEAHIDIELRLVVNSGCTFQCLFAQFHALAAGHEDVDDAPRLPLCDTQTPEALIKSRWIRPEDLGAYEALGFDDFVIMGRDKSTEWIAGVVRAYSAGRFNGNLAALLDTGTAPHLYLDNNKLRGVLDAFFERDCGRGCHTCEHCRNVAERAIRRIR